MRGSTRPQRRGALRRPGLVLLLAAGVLAGAGCTRLRQPPLRVAQDASAASFDPHHQNEVIAWSTLCNFYDALVQFSPEMRLEPALATSWQQLDARHLRIELRPGVVFHNGQRLTAADVVASFARARDDPRSAIRHHLVGIEKVEADGELGVVVSTVAPSPTLLNRLAFLFIVPAQTALLPEIRDAVGTGPYRWIGRSANGTITAKAFAGWHGLPPIEDAEFSFVSNDSARAADFVAGKSDVCAQVSDDLAVEIARTPGLRLVPQQRLAVQMLAIIPQAASGEARRALADARVRRALLLAIDRDALVTRAYRGNGIVASQFVHPAVFGYDPGVSPEAYDPDEARRLLSQAGFAGGFEVELGHGMVTGGVIESIVSNLERVGVRVKANGLPFGELLGRVRAGKVPILLFSRTCTTGDASEFLDSSIHTPAVERGLGGENYGGYTDVETDALLERADHELDRAKRLDLLQRAQRRALEALPFVPLTVRWGYLGVTSRVEVVTRHDAWLWVAAFRWAKQ